MKSIFYFLSILSLLSCERKTSNLELENTIIDELFVAMVDSIHKDNRIYLNFPPIPERIYDKKGNLINIDSTQYKKEIVTYNAEIEKIKKDTSKLPMTVSKELYFPSEYSLESIKKYFKSNALKIDTTNTETNTIIIEKFKKNPKFNFSYTKKDETPQDRYLRVEPYSIVSFSKIIFDESKNTAVLIGSYSCGGKCGLGYLIILHKKDGKWKIKQIEDLWIS
ncbi:hypothetical protein ACYE2N_02325 [Flavobacterium sp. MAHUQ-51]|uniref:hypothetical protein n=1 Tax=Flavobacterium sp. GCM10022190 TaxID=3252639 RepID=UPI0036216D47